MAQRTLQDCFDDLGGMLHGRNANKITNPFSVARRAAQNLLIQIDLDELRQIGSLTLFDQVTDYSTPLDLKEKAVLDIRPQYNAFKDRPVDDNLGSRMSKDFDLRRRAGSWFTVMNNNGLQYIRVKTHLQPSATELDDMQEISGWTAGGSGQNLQLDTIIFDDGALQFDIAFNAGNTSGYIQSTALAAQDFTDIVNKSSAFVTLYIPNTAALAAIHSVNLIWGNDVTANYYTRTVTTAQLGNLKIGKNLLRFDWNGATLNPGATVNLAQIDSARVTVNTNGTAISALIVSDLFFSVGNIWDMEYYSKYMFQSKTGVWSDTPSDFTDIVNLDTASYNLYLYELGHCSAQQIQGANGEADLRYFEERLYGNAAKNIEGEYDIYKKNNPSQREKVTQTYYTNLGWRGRGGDRVRRW